MGFSRYPSLAVSILVGSLAIIVLVTLVYKWSTALLMNSRKSLCIIVAKLIVAGSRPLRLFSGIST